MTNVYLKLTAEFNHGRLRAVICSGQAAVLHRVAIMSKDGDWILREDEESLGHILSVLESHGAEYRYGAPLDVRWLRSGWSSHFQFMDGALRVRTDFFTRPPRVPPDRLARLWSDLAGVEPAVVDVEMLALMKMTNREKDYAVIGELARRMSDPGNRLLYSRSARDLLLLAHEHPELAVRLSEQRLLLGRLSQSLEDIEADLDAERRTLMRANERRLAIYEEAAAAWRMAWKPLAERVRGLPLRAVHEQIVDAAAGVLPQEVPIHAS